MRTKGAVLWDVREPWSVEEIELGGPRAGEVLVRLTASGMCHSDEHLVTGDTIIGFPVLGGHEGAGVVLQVGPGVTTLAEGDHVVTAFIPACGHCLPCSRGQQQLCDLGAAALTGLAISDRTHRIQARGRNVIPMCLLGTFAPYITVHQASLVKIDNDVALDVAALLACGVATGWGSASKVAEVRPGDIVVVMGAGGVGMNAIQGAAAAGARCIVAIDPQPTKQRWSRTFGATHSFSSVADAAEALLEITLGRMADQVIITVGRIDGSHVGEAMSLTGKGGRVVVVGMGDMNDTSVELNLTEFALFEKQMRGVIFGGLSPRGAIPSLVNLYRQGKLKLDELITARYCLDDINQGYADMRAGRNIRGLITYGPEDF